MSRIKSLYVHFPFCTKFCPYCDYPKTLYDKDLIDPYFKSLSFDLESMDIDKNSLTTIYFGGGTPNALPLAKLLSFSKEVSKYLNKKEEYEWTIEMNPELVTEEYLIAIKKTGINRISLGVQTFNDTQLLLLGRKITEKEAIQKIQLVKKHFDNYSIDLIYGLPKDERDTLIDNLKIAQRLRIPHLSFYPLTIHENTPYFKLGVQELSEENYALFTTTINHVLFGYRYKHYEITNYALSKEKFGRHNSVYWTGDEYFAIGLGAHGYVKSVRYHKSDNMQSYLENPIKRYDERKINKKERIEEFFLLNLRTSMGISYSLFRERFGQDIPRKVLARINQPKTKEMLLITNDGFSVREEYFSILDHIVLKIIG